MTDLTIDQLAKFYGVPSALVDARYTTHPHLDQVMAYQFAFGEHERSWAKKFAFAQMYGSDMFVLPRPYPYPREKEKRMFGKKKSKIKWLEKVVLNLQNDLEDRMRRDTRQHNARREENVILEAAIIGLLKKSRGSSAFLPKADVRKAGEYQKPYVGVEAGHEHNAAGQPVEGYTISVVTP